MSGHHLERIGRKIDALEKRLRPAHAQEFENVTIAELKDEGRLENSAPSSRSASQLLENA